MWFSNMTIQLGLLSFLYLLTEAWRCHTSVFHLALHTTSHCLKKCPELLCERQKLSAQGWQQALAFLLDETNPAFSQPQNHLHRALAYL